MSQLQDDRIPIGKGKGWLERARKVTKGWSDWTQQLDQCFDRDFAAAIGFPDVFFIAKLAEWVNCLLHSGPLGKAAPRFHGHR